MCYGLLLCHQSQKATSMDVQLMVFNHGYANLHDFI